MSGITPVAPGEPVSASKINAIIDAVNSLQPVAGHGVAIDRLHNGVRISAIAQDSFQSPPLEEDDDTDYEPPTPMFLSPFLIDDDGTAKIGITPGFVHADFFGQQTLSLPASGEHFVCLITNPEWMQAGQNGYEYAFKANAKFEVLDKDETKHLYQTDCILGRVYNGMVQTLNVTNKRILWTTVSGPRRIAEDRQITTFNNQPILSYTDQLYLALYVPDANNTEISSTPSSSSSSSSSGSGNITIDFPEVSATYTFAVNYDFTQSVSGSLNLESVGGDTAGEMTIYSEQKMANAVFDVNSGSVAFDMLPLDGYARFDDFRGYIDFSLGGSSDGQIRGQITRGYMTASAATTGYLEFRQSYGYLESYIYDGYIEGYIGGEGLGKTLIYNTTINYQCVCYCCGYGYGYNYTCTPNIIDYGPYCWIVINSDCSWSIMCAGGVTPAQSYAIGGTSAGAPSIGLVRFGPDGYPIASQAAQATSTYIGSADSSPCGCGQSAAATPAPFTAPIGVPITMAAAVPTATADDNIGSIYIAPLYGRAGWYVTGGTTFYNTRGWTKWEIPPVGYVDITGFTGSISNSGSINGYHFGMLDSGYLIVSSPKGEISTTLTFPYNITLEISTDPKLKLTTTGDYTLSGSVTGTHSVTGTWTIPAHTATGTVSGGGAGGTAPKTYTATHGIYGYIPSHYTYTNLPMTRFSEPPVSYVWQLVNA